jgi:hypothetical protein
MESTNIATARAKLASDGPIGAASGEGNFVVRQAAG